MFRLAWASDMPFEKKKNLISLTPYCIFYFNTHGAASWQNQQNDVRPAKIWLAWASAQSDQSLRCPHEESLGP